MMERYTRVFSLEGDLYCPGSPVVVRGALLKDGATGAVLAQLKLGRISAQGLRAVTVAVQPLDVAGAPLGEPVSHQYLDIQAPRGGEFGQREPVVLPDASARSFAVVSLGAVLEDGSRWDSAGAALSAIPARRPLEERFGDPGLMRQFQMELGDTYKYRYDFGAFADLWRCACGALNHQSESACHACGLDRGRLTDVDVARLMARRDERLAKEAAKVRRSRRIGAALVALAVLAIAAALVYTQVVVPAQERAAEEAAVAEAAARRAQIAAERHAQEEAAAAEAERLAAEEAVRIEPLKVVNGALNLAQVGDSVYLGTYEQDNYPSDGAEPIEWRVLSVESGRALLISERGLDAHVFNSDRSKGNDWETSDLKAWLEGEFTATAFSVDELALIDGAPFCLKIDGAQDYFASDGDRVCYPTDYAVAQGVYEGSNGACEWWLRSPGAGSDLAAFVGTGGRVGSGGYHVDDGDVAVRPALWVNL